MKRRYTNTLFIPDLHAPGTLPGAVAWLKKVAKQYDVKRVVAVGDIVDLAFASFHEHDPDLDMSPNDEIDGAIKVLKRFYSAFPEADLMIGNHDDRISRVGGKLGLPKRTLACFGDVFEVPKSWKVHSRFTKLDLFGDGRWLCCHGDDSPNGSICAAFNKAKAQFSSVVCGHHERQPTDSRHAGGHVD
jgi:hypothetical protein